MTKIYGISQNDWLVIIRLKSGNFGALNAVNETRICSSDCRASKSISNGIKLEPISWELKIENPFLNFCVGVWVGWHPFNIFRLKKDYVWFIDINISHGVSDRSLSRQGHSEVIIWCSERLNIAKILHFEFIMIHNPWP